MHHMGLLGISTGLLSNATEGDSEEVGSTIASDVGVEFSWLLVGGFEVN